MRRRDFFQTAGAAALGAGLVSKSAAAFVPSHNWEKHDFGSGPAVRDRLYQGPFPQYAPEPVVPGSSVVMTTNPSREIVPNYGMGLTVYISGDFWPPRTQGERVTNKLFNATCRKCLRTEQSLSLPIAFRPSAWQIAF